MEAVPSTAVRTESDTEPATEAGGRYDAAIVPTGFESVRATVTESDGTMCELCLWLADTGERRSQGLMFVTDLGIAEAVPGGADVDGMAFVYPRPHSGSFWMKNTVLPLSIAFFGPGGEFVDEFDMEPCTEDPCPTYPTPADFLIAVEVPQGDLPALGIAPGSVLELSDLPCAG